MFYLKEIFFRAQFFFLSGFILAGLCYTYKRLLLFVLTFNSLGSTSKGCSFDSGADYFIYTHPSELFTTYFLVIFHFTFMLTFHLILWHLIDFSRSSLKQFELGGLNTMIKVTASTLYGLNFLFLVLIFPSCWSFFESFNESSDKRALKFFLELKIKDYIDFLESLLYSINACFLLIVTLHFLLSFQSFKVLLQWKKLFFFFSLTLIVVCGFSDLLSQSLGALMLWIFLEFTIMLRVIRLKTRKYTKIRQTKSQLNHGF